MKITIQISGKIETRKEKIEAVLDVPDGWKPDWNEWSKVLGTIRFLTEKMEQEFTPKMFNN